MIPFGFFDEMAKVATAGHVKKAYYTLYSPFVHKAIDTALANKGLVAAGVGGIAGFQLFKRLQQNAAMGKYLRDQQKQPPMMTIA
jgi:hypothetical protein